jgi:CysZ protein
VSVTPSPVGFLRALTFPVRGLGHFLTSPQLWPYMAAAFALNLLLLGALIWLAIEFGDDLARWLMPEKAWGWLKATAEWAARLLMALLLLLSFTFIGNIIAGPFLEAMTEKMMIGLGERPPAPRGFLGALGRSVVNQGTKLVLFAAIQFGLLFLLVIPGVNLAHPVISGFVTVLFLGLEYFDYPLEFRGLSALDRFGYGLRNLGPTLGFGAILFLVLLVPCLGYLFLPVSVCGATLLVHEHAEARVKA